MSIVIYPSILRKLQEKHGVSREEVEQAFANRTGKLAEEMRPKNQGDSPRFWFISETDSGRRLKVVFVFDDEESGPVVITAYEPNIKEESLYESLQ
jgi:uncharacterized DUF497 family protein